MSMAQFAHNSSKELFKKLEYYGKLKEVSDDEMRSILPKLPLRDRAYISEEHVRHQYSIGKLKLSLEEYFKSYEEGIDIKERIKSYKGLAESHPHNPDFERQVNYLQMQYDNIKKVHEKSKTDFDNALRDTVAYQIVLHKVTGRVPMPDQKEISDYTGIYFEKHKLETLITISLGAAFTLLFAYFRNPPGTTGYLALPGYESVYILMSIIVFAALFFVFRKKN